MRNRLCMHCEITHLIARKVDCPDETLHLWPFTGRDDGTRGDSPSPSPCQWPATLYLEVLSKSRPCSITSSTRFTPTTTSSNARTSRTPPGRWTPVLARSAGRIRDYLVDWWTKLLWD